MFGKIKLIIAVALTPSISLEQLATNGIVNKHTTINKKIAIIPVYNVIYLVKKVFGDGLYSIILLIPFINVLFWFIFLYRLAKMFKLNNYQTVLLMFLPLVFLPILAYGNVGNFKKSNISYDNVLKTTLLWLLTGLLLFISLIFGFVYFKNNRNYS